MGPLGAAGTKSTASKREEKGKPGSILRSRSTLTEQATGRDLRPSLRFKRREDGGAGERNMISRDLFMDGSKSRRSDGKERLFQEPLRESKGTGDVLRKETQNESSLFLGKKGVIKGTNRARV